MHRTIAAVLLGAVGALISPTPGQVDPQIVWERVIRAKGGREKLHAVSTLAWSIDGPKLNSAPDVIGAERLEFVEAYPDRYWLWMDYRPGSMGFHAEVWNAQKRFWFQSNRGGKAHSIPWSSAAEWARRRDRTKHGLVFLLETSFVAPTLTKARTEGDSIYLEGTAPQFISVTYTIDTATYLPRRIAVTPEAAPEWGPLPPALTTEYVIRRYSAIDGIQMPTVIDGYGEVRFTINPAVDQKLFETPPDGVTSRDEWKKYLRGISLSHRPAARPAMSIKSI